MIERSLMRYLDPRFICHSLPWPIRNRISNTVLNLLLPVSHNRNRQSGTSQLEIPTGTSQTSPSWTVVFDKRRRRKKKERQIDVAIRNCDCDAFLNLTCYPVDALQAIHNMKLQAAVMVVVMVVVCHHNVSTFQLYFVILQPPPTHP